MSTFARNLSAALAAVLWLFASPGEGRAYQVEPAPWSVLVAESERIVHGHVMARWSAWAPDGSGRVITQHEVLVWNEYQTGGPRGTARVIVTLPGGQYGGRTTVVPGLGGLAIGDEVLLLLTTTPWGWQPIGYELGILRLSQGEPWPTTGTLTP